MKRNVLSAAIAVLLASLGLISGCSSLGAAGRSMDTIDHTAQQDLKGGPN